MTAKTDNLSSPEASRTPKASHGFCVERLVGLRCWWSGCECNPYVAEICPRCERQTAGHPGAWDRMKFWWRYHHPKWMRPLDFFRKCPDCGNRFGKHTEECPPF